MYLETRRNKVFESMSDQSIAVIFSGRPKHRSADNYYPFSVNRNFFYLTDIDKDNMVLVLIKNNQENRTLLFIEESNPFIEKWDGKKMKKEEAIELSKIQDIYYHDSFDGLLTRLYNSSIKHLYVDTFRNNLKDEESIGSHYGRKMTKKYPHLKIENLFPIIASLRMNKDEHEVTQMKKAISITNEGINKLMDHSKEGLLEYQLQSIFEQHLQYNGTKPSFATIAACGYNATTLHYIENNNPLKNNELVLFDLGVNYQNYCSDITRTFPVNGKFTNRQKEIYNIVLEANKMIIKEAKPGLTLMELNNMTKKVLGDGLKRLGVMKDDSELSKYYMHGVGHHLGLDVHDVTNGNKTKLEPGMVITNEPGLYIEEESIGIRIEDDILITEDGCINLSSEIIKEIDEIEAYMANRK